MKNYENRIVKLERVLGTFNANKKSNCHFDVKALSSDEIVKLSELFKSINVGNVETPRLDESKLTTDNLNFLNTLVCIDNYGGKNEPI